MKPLEEMTFEELRAWATGTLTLSIGEGRFSKEVGRVLEAALRLGFNRGKANQKTFDGQD